MNLVYNMVLILIHNVSFLSANFALISHPSSFSIGRPIGLLRRSAGPTGGTHWWHLLSDRLLESSFQVWICDWVSTNIIIRNYTSKYYIRRKTYITLTNSRARFESYAKTTIIYYLTTVLVSIWFGFPWALVKELSISLSLLLSPVVVSKFSNI